MRTAKLAVWVTALALLASAAVADQPRPTRSKLPTVVVYGEGSASAKPELAEVDVAVVSEAATAQQAVSQNSESMQELLDTLSRFGIESRDVQTRQFNVAPRFERGRDRQGPPQIAGYTVVNELHVRVVDLQRLGELLDAVVASGANQVRGIQMMPRDLAPLRNAALAAAVEDALKRARAIVGALGIPPQAAEIVEVRQLGGGVTPIPGPRLAVEAARAVPIAEGESTITAQVQVTIGLAERPRLAD